MFAEDSDISISFKNLWFSAYPFIIRSFSDILVFQILSRLSCSQNIVLKPFCSFSCHSHCRGWWWKWDSPAIELARQVDLDANILVKQEEMEEEEEDFLVDKKKRRRRKRCLGWQKVTKGLAPQSSSKWYQHCIAKIWRKFLGCGSLIWRVEELWAWYKDGRKFGKDFSAEGSWDPCWFSGLALVFVSEAELWFEIVHFLSFL